MKSIFTFFLSLLFTVAIAQDKVFTHTADPTNISADLTVIDHPDLNGNSGAFFISTHNLNVGGVQYNNNVTGAFYDGSNWGIYNENGTGMVDGSSYNVYIPVGGNVITVQADGSSYALQLDNAAINDNPNAVLVYGTYWNPSGVRNDNNYGFWYDGTRWNIYNNETTTSIPANAAFNILIDDGTGGADYFIHDAVAPTSNYTTIDHPSLNGKPNAFPIVSHNWGTSGDPSNILLDTPIGVWYDGSNWTIYTEDVSTMPTNARFNVYVAADPLGVEDNVSLELSTYPNPTKGIVTISAQHEINSVTVYNILGQEVKTVSGSSNSVEVNLSEFATGHYIAKVEAGNSTESIKIIKE